MVFQPSRHAEEKKKERTRNEVRRPPYWQAIVTVACHTVLLEGDGRLPRDYSISQNVSNEGKYNGHVKTRHTR